jgi:UTP--glucose-1-phosphate uridylyltransferase
VKIKKAVITAAAPSQRALPLQTLIDRDGEAKPVLGILVEQVLLSRVEEICVVVSPGDEARYAQAVEKHLGHVRFVSQEQPRGHATRSGARESFWAASRVCISARVGGAVRNESGPPAPFHFTM